MTIAMKGKERTAQQHMMEERETHLDGAVQEEFLEEMTFKLSCNTDVSQLPVFKEVPRCLALQ